MSEADIKRQVREFYDQVGWQLVGEGQYQNARYEDLRPVSWEYIHRCHLRVGRFLKPNGKYLLDAGSGPVQYPEYLTYSQGYQYRVCADISIVALQEARKHLGAKGLCVVADVANLPFKPEVFDGVVSLHTLHHLPTEDHERAYLELYRVLAPASSAVVVNGWTESRFLIWVDPLVHGAEILQTRRYQRSQPVEQESQTVEPKSPSRKPTGTFIHKYDAEWLKQILQGRMDFEIRVWRSVNVRFLRNLIHTRLGGRMWLRLLYAMEERFPHFFGVKGQYPMVILRKPGTGQK
jgi:ubiquinone/menaquinone biosynthesis C-methylase UbiE